MIDPRMEVVMAPDGGLYYVPEGVTIDWSTFKNYSGVIEFIENISSPSQELECHHEVVDVGFHFTKLVCKKCNREVPS